MPTARVRRLGLRGVVGRVLVIALVVPGIVAGSAPSASAGTAVSFATLYASGSDPILVEGNNLFFPHQGTFQVSGSATTGVQVDLAEPLARDGYRLRFTAPTGGALTTAAYEQAQAVPDADHAEIEITRGATGCDSTGRFDVLDLAPDLSHFWIVYQHLCDGQSAPAFGEIRYNLPSGPGLTVAAGRIAWPTATFDHPGRPVPIQVTNYGSEPVTLTGTSVSGAGTANFAAHGESCGTLARNTSCSVTVEYRPVTVGPAQATLLLTDSAGGFTAVTLVGTGLRADDPGIVRAVGVPPGPVAGVFGEADYTDLTLHWYNPTDIDWTDTVVRMTSGTTPPASPDAGTALYVGRSQTVQVTDLDPGTPYSFAFFARDAEGFFAPPATLSINATTVSVSANRSRLTFGDPVVFTGVVRDLHTGNPLEFTDVRVFAYDPRANQVLLAGETKAHAGGKYQVAVTPGTTYEYYVVARGDPAHLGGVSRALTIPVSAAAVLEPVKKKGKFGTTFLMFGGADPIHTGKPLVLEQKVKGKWKPVQKVKPNRNGVAKFKVKPKTRGKHVYRLSKAATPGVGAGTSRQITIRVI